MEPEKKRKRGGRKRGIPNKATANLKQAVNDLIDNNWNKIQTDLESLTARDRLAFIEKLIAYALPKPQTIDVQANVTNRLENLNDEQLNTLIDHILDGKIL